MKRGNYKSAQPKHETFTCAECGASFDYGWRTRRPTYCTDVCRGVAIKRNMAKADLKYRMKSRKPPQPRDCAYCQTLFTPGGSRADARFCGLKCGNRGRAIERIYKITIEFYHDMYEEQGGCCAGCLLPFGNKVPHVDHDHETGRVRGLLHGQCNSILGFIDDDATKLDKLAEYLRRE